MSNRAGSLIVAAVLAVVTAFAAAVIFVLVADDTGAGDTLVSISLRDQQQVRLGDPLEIRVAARGSEPLTSVALSVDGVLITRAEPVQDLAQGTFSAGLSWIPDRLGATRITVSVLSLSGQETERTVRVEVVEELDAVAVQVTVIRPHPLQRVAVGERTLVVAQAQSTETVRAFQLLVGGAVVTEVPAATGENGLPTGALEWTPEQEGLVVLRVRALTQSDAQGLAEVTVEAVRTDAAAADSTAGEDGDDPFAGISGEAGQVMIIGLEDGDEIEVAAGEPLTIPVLAQQTGRLVSLDFFVNAAFTQGGDLTPREDGAYQVEFSFLPADPGPYALEVVAINANGRRFDNRVEITITGGGDAEDGGAADSGLPDLAPTAISVAAASAIRLTLANQGDADLPATAILISVIRSADGILLDEATLNVTLDAGTSQTFTLPVALTNALDITVVVDTANAVEEADETNNELAVRFQPRTLPDLAPADLQVVPGDRVVLVRVQNIGSQPYTGPLRVQIVFGGRVTEQITFNGAIPAQGSITLSGVVPITGAGSLSAVVDPDNTITEASESNNALTITVPG